MIVLYKVIMLLQSDKNIQKSNELSFSKSLLCKLQKFVMLFRIEAPTFKAEIPHFTF